MPTDPDETLPNATPKIVIDLGQTAPQALERYPHQRRINPNGVATYPALTRLQVLGAPKRGVKPLF